MRRTPSALLVVAVLLAGCGGDAPDRKNPLPSESVETPTPSVKRSPSPSPTPRPTGPPPITGDPLSASGAYLRLATSDTVVNPASCEEAYPELLDVSCDDFRLAAGGVLWVAGTQDAGGGERQWVLRLHTFVPSSGGYVMRYQAVDPEGTWRGFRLLPAKLTGFGVDSIVVQVLIEGAEARRGYDILTWRSGGPLVLRAHRPEGPRMRLVVKDLMIEEYSSANAGGPYAHRRIRWDGVRFRSAGIALVPQSQVPPAS